MTNPVISAAEVKRLRDETGAGMMDCKRALTETAGDFEAAKELLKTWGLTGVALRASRTAAEGAIGNYLHQLDPELPPKVGVLVELNCETDFVAKTPEFRNLAREIALHVAAMEPRWVSRAEIPEDHLERERQNLLSSDEFSDRSRDVVEKIVSDRLDSVLSERGGVLLEQPFCKDEAKKVADLIGEVAASVKENIVVRRFARFRVGEEE
ncbi:MAG: elongation factor Ts [Candidatus Methylomirabilales bacterium]